MQIEEPVAVQLKWNLGITCAGIHWRLSEGYSCSCGWIQARWAARPRRPGWGMQPTVRKDAGGC